MKEFLKSFGYAFNGVLTAIKTQRNFRIHIIAMIYVIAFSYFYELSKYEYMILILTFVLVISSELINTALENIVDLCSPEYNKLAKIGKDCAAGAVLVSAIAAIIIGIFLFADTEIFIEIIDFFRYNHFYFVMLIISVIFSVIFIIYPNGNGKGKVDEYKN